MGTPLDAAVSGTRLSMNTAIVTIESIFFNLFLSFLFLFFSLFSFGAPLYGMFSFLSFVDNSSILMRRTIKRSSYAKRYPRLIYQQSSSKRCFFGPESNPRLNHQIDVRNRLRKKGDGRVIALLCCWWTVLLWKYRARVETERADIIRTIVKAAVFLDFSPRTF